MLNGAVSIDEMRYEDFSALTLRLYAHSTGKWTIHWVNGQSGLLQTPVAGTWTNGELTAVGEDEFVGRAILGSYRWWQIAASSARWEQAFSVDDGQTWETNDMFLG